ncbi:hypothetical protein PR048_012612 [Dryococelus australis]|uniref:Integrase catalytic domain-containing protein n=1 Tax=Dryococelus australis TaxID=614101 RepID=A0ABQ9HQQ0_9NEOP|nr:hypothetical protein PR048_012612 [Dryococelus australis]
MDVEKWAIKGKTASTINRGQEKQRDRKKTFQNKLNPRAYQADIPFTAFSCEVTSKDYIFVPDSGATIHLIVGSLEEYITLPHIVVIKSTNGGEMIATRAGKFIGDYSSETVSFEALIVPGLKNNLKEKVTIKGRNISVECEKGHLNLFLLKLNPMTENTKHTIACQEFGEIITTSETSLWHRRLGLLNSRGLQLLNLLSSDEKCPQCLEGKAKGLLFKKNEKPTQSIGELLHSDISGPAKTMTKEGERHFQVIVDDFSHFTTMYLLKTKSEAEQNLMNLIKMAKTQHGFKLIQKLCSDKGMIIEYPTQYTPQHNSKAERMNLTLTNKVWTKSAETDHSRTLWGEAVRASAYDLNISPTSILQNSTPASVWFGENDFSKIMVYGSQENMLKLP